MSRRLQRPGARGYTLVELMMALALFSVAIVGIISMQKITVVSNAHSRNAATAQRIAQAWAAQLEMDATQWRNTFGTGFLNSDAAWARPAYDSTRAFGAAFDGLGNPLADTTTALAQAHFCTHVRMSWLYAPSMNVTGNNLLRAEIRVFWLREGEVPFDSTASMCQAVQAVDQVLGISMATDRYHFIYQTVGVRQHFQI